MVKRRRNSFALFFIAVSWMGAGMGLDIKNGLIAKDFSAFLEKKLDAAFAGKEVKLDKIGGGVFGNLTINDFSVSENSSPIFSVDRVVVKYNLFNLLMRRFENSGRIYLVSPSIFFTQKKEAPAISPAPAAAPLTKRANLFYGPVRFQILNGSICGFNGKPVLNNMAGVVVFHNSRLSFNGLRGSFLNLPVVVNGRIENPLDSPVVKLRLLITGKYYTARLAFKSSGQKGEGAVRGYVKFFDKFGVSFRGRINIVSADTIEIKDFLVEDQLAINGEINLSNGSSKFTIRPSTGAIKILTNCDREKGFSIHSKLDHISPFGFDILSQLNIKTDLCELRDSAPFLRGQIETQNLIVNYKPFKEIRASWILKKDELFITSLELGSEYRLFGRIGLDKPYNMDLTLSANGALVEDWLVFSKYEEPGKFSGLLNGKLKIQGPLKEPVTKGNFSVREGNIKKVRFNAINFNLKGKGPILTISDSRIIKDGGFLYIEGYLDLRKFGKRNVFENVNIKTDQRIVVWEGWDISKDIDTSEVKLEKEINEDFGVNFRTYTGGEDVSEDRKDTEIGVDYKIKKDDSINLRMKEDSAFVGVEHKVKF